MSLERNVSIIQDVDGNNIVMINDIIFKGKQSIRWDEVERFNVFRVAMIIRHGEDDKKYLYDVINVKKETSNLFQSEDLTQSKNPFHD